jgi:hypothetical protein
MRLMLPPGGEGTLASQAEVNSRSDSSAGASRMMGAWSRHTPRAPSG